MLKPASHYRIDWRREFATLAPYLNGNGGVIGVEYDSEEAAIDKFNHLIKEGFARPGDHMWTSLRVDHEWFTTRRVAGILDEMDRLLADAGFPAERACEGLYALNLFSGNDVAGDLRANLTNVTLQMDGPVAGAAFRGRVRAVSEAMCRYIASGGHFMIVINDTPIPDQAGFWHEIWLGGLAKACGDKLLVIVHAGPRAERRYHADAPVRDRILYLPDSFESDETRENDAYDDLFEVFKAEGFECPEESAGAYLDATLFSVRLLHLRLSAALMNKNIRSGERKR
ncbi:hypothetical protein MZO42_04940 [Sphingomonas psychrotolerans]|uniref:Uncharacterized protein n=1 Tax=Sphingomonas psychrotolerans TaxID=1327635 RepID=A0ABU3N0H3_9SPHN|nr:hypothetical protein [Sphingomonas psychrotolerans]MDT8758035.1 hypothetical protein [Sphingomonas psychrotolerans]